MVLEKKRENLSGSPIFFFTKFCRLKERLGQRKSEEVLALSNAPTKTAPSDVGSILSGKASLSPWQLGQPPIAAKLGGHVTSARFPGESQHGYLGKQPL